MAIVNIAGIRKSRLDIDTGSNVYHILAGGGIRVDSGNAIAERAGVSGNEVLIDGRVYTADIDSFAIFSEGRNGSWTLGATGVVAGGSGLYFSGDGSDLVNNGRIIAGRQSAVWFDGGRHDMDNAGDIAAKRGVGVGVSAGLLDIDNSGAISGKVAIYAGHAGLLINNGTSGEIKGRQAAIWSTSDEGAVIANDGVVSSPNWALLLGSGNDRVVNRGDMVGQVDLGGGRDVFTQVSGLFEGFLFMGGGNDRFVYQGGAFESAVDSVTWIRGGKGNDVYDTGDLYVVCVEAANGGHDTQYAAIGTWLRDNVEDLVLTGTGDIYGEGNDLANVIIGNSASNRLYGYGGADRLEGGAGLDYLRGGAGRDVFVFGETSGNDIITDWEDGVDRIDLSGIAGIDDFGDLAGAFSDVGVDVVITIGANTITVSGMSEIDIADFDASDFIF